MGLLVGGKVVSHRYQLNKCQPWQRLFDLPVWQYGIQLNYCNIISIISTLILYRPTGVYWGSDEDDWASRLDFTYQSHSIAILFWCVGYIGVWTLVAGVLHFKKIYIKI